MQPASPRIVDLLNDALTFELTVTNTYFLHARMLDSWGFGRLGKVFYDLSIDEMRDADDLINRILLFDGHPNVQRLNAIQVGENAEEMLRLAFESEKAAVTQFNASAKECHELGDHGSAAVFEEMVRDEEKHADWFESQLDAIERVGVNQYLAQQIDPGGGGGGPGGGGAPARPPPPRRSADCRSVSTAPRIKRLIATPANRSSCKPSPR